MLELVYNIVLLPILLVCFMLVKLSIRCYDVYVCSFDLLYLKRIMMSKFKMSHV